MTKNWETRLAAAKRLDVKGSHFPVACRERFFRAVIIAGQGQSARFASLEAAQRQ